MPAPDPLADPSDVGPGGLRPSTLISPALHVAIAGVTQGAIGVFLALFLSLPDSIPVPGDARGEVDGWAEPTNWLWAPSTMFFNHALLWFVILIPVLVFVPRFVRISNRLREVDTP